MIKGINKMLDHIALDVVDLNKSKEFYLPILSLLGYTLVTEWEDWIGFELDEKVDFWLRQGVQTKPAIHIAFRANSRSMVERFYQLALTQGGKDNGAPEIRHYPNYYCAYILDPDGHDIEIVCRG